MPPRATALIIACATAALAIEAQAIGFGRLSTSAVLGQPLNLPVPLRLEPGERIEPECVSAEIVLGDNALSHDRFRVRLEPSGRSTNDWVARITTLVPIDEPVLDITLTVGCDRRFSRRFVAFADPPAVSQARAAPIEPESVAAPASGVVALVANEAGPAAEAPRRSTKAAATPPVRKPARSASQAHAKAEPKATRTGKRRATAAASPAPTRPSAVAANGGARLLLEIDGPRLKLDMEEPIFMPPAVAAGDGAASVPDGEAASMPEADRLRMLEKALADLQREGQASRETAAILKARLVEAENRGRAVPWLIGLVLLAMGIAAWLAWRSRRHHLVNSEVPPHWWSPAGEAAGAAEPAGQEDGPVDEPPPSNLGDLDVPREAADTSPLPAALALERDLPAPGGGAISSRSPSSMPPVVFQPEPLHERTMVISSPPSFMRPEPASEPAVAREVSVEELLDLEQQADFFIALGQEEAAIDLLMAHLRSTGGLSPLPYTKLLEIYRRQGDRDAYERIRTRFNRRFNAYAPEWEDGPLSGRALEDYPDVVQHLQSLWPEPLDAMAMLEAMLFRKDAAYELFDLPAYKDVLLLYALARDLWQQGGSRSSAVDVLLPLGDDPGPDAQVGVDPTPSSASAPADVPPFELTAFALPPLPGQVAPSPASPSSNDEAGDPGAEPAPGTVRRPQR
ncbi:FimV family protein [Ideonella sp.]|uniref:type IV pilus assembly protein FimV n=1 Tax=Ideonella sp. TaxID=1929293 RepID=UPI0035B18068